MYASLIILLSIFCLTGAVAPQGGPGGGREHIPSYQHRTSDAENSAATTAKNTLLRVTTARRAMPLAVQRAAAAAARAAAQQENLRAMTPFNLDDTEGRHNKIAMLTSGALAGASSEWSSTDDDDDDDDDNYSSCSSSSDSDDPIDDKEGTESASTDDDELAGIISALEFGSPQSSRSGESSAAVSPVARSLPFPAVPSAMETRARMATASDADFTRFFVSGLLRRLEAPYNSALTSRSQGVLLRGIFAEAMRRVERPDADADVLFDAAIRAAQLLAKRRHRGVSGAAEKLLFQGIYDTHMPHETRLRLFRAVHGFCRGSERVALAVQASLPTLETYREISDQPHLRDTETTVALAALLSARHANLDPTDAPAGTVGAYVADQVLTVMACAAAQDQPALLALMLHAYAGLQRHYLPYLQRFFVRLVHEPAFEPLRVQLRESLAAGDPAKRLDSLEIHNAAVVQILRNMRSVLLSMLTTEDGPYTLLVALHKLRKAAPLGEGTDLVAELVDSVLRQEGALIARSLPRVFAQDARNLGPLTEAMRLLRSDVQLWRQVPFRQMLSLVIAHIKVLKPDTIVRVAALLLPDTEARRLVGDELTLLKWRMLQRVAGTPTHAPAGGRLGFADIVQLMARFDPPVNPHLQRRLTVFVRNQRSVQAGMEQIAEALTDNAKAASPSSVVARVSALVGAVTHIPLAVGELWPAEDPNKRDTGDIACEVAWWAMRAADVARKAGPRAAADADASLAEIMRIVEQKLELNGHRVTFGRVYQLASMQYMPHRASAHEDYDALLSEFARTII